MDDPWLTQGHIESLTPSCRPLTVPVEGLIATWNRATEKSV